MQPIPSENDGTLMTIGEFNQNVEFGALTPDDGTGYYGTRDMYDEDFEVFPNEPYEQADFERIARNFTHVVWFNK